MDSQRRQLAEERTELARRIAEQNAAWESRSEEAQQQWRRRREALTRRSEQLDRRRTAIESLHAEAMQAHRETLEIRLAVEQTWMELQGRHAPAALTQSLTEARRKLVEHSQQAAASMGQQREELEFLFTRPHRRWPRVRQSWCSVAHP